MKQPLAIAFLLLLLCQPIWAKPLTPYNQGYDQGRQAGRREGQERGREYGQVDGEEDGYAAGYQQALQGFLGQAQEDGYQSGTQLGTSEGLDQGSADGRRLGTEEGRREGALAGERSADETALREVTPKATAAGIERARTADPEADGLREGRIDGKKRAEQSARQEDYEAARKQFREQRYAGAPAQRIEQRQNQLSSAPTWPTGNLEFVVGKRPRPACDFRYCSYPSDNEEFQKGYRKGYRAGYHSGFDNKYQWYYDIEFRRALTWGANQARPGNLDEVREESHQAAYETAFQNSYEKALAEAKERAYAEAFKVAFSEAYSRFYPQYLDSHYKRVEGEAFESLYRETYLLNFQRASEEWYAKTLPGARKRAFQQGLADEKADFQRRPVRLLEAWLTPTDVGEISLLTVRLRNFSDRPVAGHRVHLFWGPEKSRLYHTLPANSVVTVTGAFKTRSGTLLSRDLTATLTDSGKDLSLGTVSVWPTPANREG